METFKVSPIHLRENTWAYPAAASQNTGSNMMSLAVCAIRMSNREDIQAKDYPTFCWVVSEKRDRRRERRRCIRLFILGSGFGADMDGLGARV